MARIAFSNWWNSAVKQVPELPLFILWSDQSTFRLNGMVNRDNCVYYSKENPNISIETQLQSPCVCVWAGMWAGGIVGPYFFEDTVDRAGYLQILETFVIPELIRLKILDFIDFIYFQQDGAPAHYHRDVRNFLQATFPGRVIGRATDIP